MTITENLASANGFCSAISDFLNGRGSPCSAVFLPLLKRSSVMCVELLLVIVNSSETGALSRARVKSSRAAVPAATHSLEIACSRNVM